jgi:hypothetical protein
MRARVILLSIALTLGCTAAAHAQTAEPSTAPTAPLPAVPPAAPTQSQSAQPPQSLFAALANEAPADQVGSQLRAEVRKAGGACRRLSEYQVVRSGPDYQTVKVKCRGQSLYSLTIMREGGTRLAGGDGQVSQMQPSDGRIFSIVGERADAYFARESAQEAAAVQAIPNAPNTEATSEKSFWRRHSTKFIVAANLVLLAVLGLVLYKMIRADRRRGGRDTTYLSGLSSEEKDTLIDEAREIYPHIYRHPDGFFIARGPNGRRRLFWEKSWARLYRDFGIKWGEIQ